MQFVGYNLHEIRLHPSQIGYSNSAQSSFTLFLLIPNFGPSRFQIIVIQSKRLKTYAFYMVLGLRRKSSRKKPFAATALAFYRACQLRSSIWPPNVWGSPRETAILLILPVQSRHWTFSLRNTQLTELLRV